ncbi:hypothetical protein TVAG_490890 [Trichomonas vaginalis G3]|uniref:C2 NT-type domain-containing protein n=1 Tax=Trichomonas vaginalis (strain ATCC PRA-98 / G3) TaxID=412133 RepID=A2E032_TRIV3|nr:N-terminal C2 in EEIG1 and EHBP1 proteins family [Trichomonas vaginalis G3]EAY13951.1 hypothetical protein TVAG_490890 [Trichomonas vaginalis G3]KAI5551762.1 N-terminal C2 in EEIG1 and EHBP1 proteins family [Trichomonas vaginalis G3]|eukprot:XP_001326174.1 hypothetical protein [Trichomonas vaginalis G3]
MNKEQVMNYIAFILVEKVQFPEKYNKPLFIRVQRKKTAGGQTKLAFSSETSYKNLDNNLIAHFDNEFSLPFTTVKKGDKYVKKVVEIQLVSVSNKKKEEVEICKWRFDASNMPDPRDPSVHFSVASSDFGNVNLYVRFCVIPAEEFSIGIPTNYFSFITKRTQAPDFGNTIDAFGISDNDIDATDSNLSSLERKTKKEPQTFSLTKEQPQEPQKKHHKSKGKHESDTTKKQKKHKSRGLDNPSSSQTDKDISIHQHPEQTEKEIDSTKTEEKESQKQDNFEKEQKQDHKTETEPSKEQINEVTEISDVKQQENVEISNSNQNHIETEQKSEITTEPEPIKEDNIITSQENIEISNETKSIEEEQKKETATEHVKEETVESVQETDEKQQENSSSSQKDNENEQKLENSQEPRTQKEEIAETIQEDTEKQQENNETSPEPVKEEINDEEQKEISNSTQNELEPENIPEQEQENQEVTESVKELNQQKTESQNPEQEQNTENVQVNEEKQQDTDKETEENKEQTTTVTIETPQQNTTENGEQEKTIKKEKSKEELNEIMRQEVEMSTFLAMKEEEERLSKLQAAEIARQEEENRLFEEKRRENEQKLQEKIKKLKKQKQIEEQKQVESEKSNIKEEVKIDQINDNKSIEETHYIIEPKAEIVKPEEEKIETIFAQEKEPEQIEEEHKKEEEEDEYEYEYVEEEIVEKVKVDIKVQEFAGTKIDTQKHLNKLKEIAVSSISVRLALKCYSCIYFKTLIRPDYPILLSRLLEKCRIFEHRDLTDDDVIRIFTPFFKSANLATSLYQIDENIYYLSSLINLGYTISSLAGELTNVHISTLVNLEKVISKVINIITQTLAATIGQSIDNDGFNFVSETSLAKLTSLSSKFLKRARDVEISDVLLQDIIVKCCCYLDSLVFNVIMESGGEINNDKVTILLENVRKIQSCFDCFSENFSTAFPNLLNFISLSQVLIGGFNEQRLRGKGPIARYIAENIRPNLQLPKKLKFEDIGPQVDKDSLKASIKIDPIEFSFEWLFVNSSTMNYDDD